MSNPSKLLAAGLLAAMFGVLALPLWSSAGTVVTERPPLPARKGVVQDPGYQVRCWQHGRLLFEEHDVDLAGDAIAGLKLRATDRYDKPVMITDTGNATCLIRSQAGGR